MHRFSIIVPLLREHADFEDTLASVLRYRPRDTQVIVVHDGSYTDPHRLSGEIQLVNAEQGGNLISFFNIGMCYVAGQITLLIRPGVELDENWNESVESAFSDPKIGSVTPLIVNSSRPARILAAGVVADRTYSRRIAGVGRKISSRQTSAVVQAGPTSWLAAYRTKVLKLITPLDEQLDPVFLDMDVAMALQRLGVENHLASDFVGIVDNNDPILAESIMPHGISAQRAARRFGDANWAQCFQSCLFELARTPFANWRLKHLLQRFRGRNMKDIDLQYAARLKMLKQSKCWLSSEPTSIAVAAARRQAA